MQAFVVAPGSGRPLFISGKITQSCSGFLSLCLAGDLVPPLFSVLGLMVASWCSVWVRVCPSGHRQEQGEPAGMGTPRHPKRGLGTQRQEEQGVCASMSVRDGALQKVPETGRAWRSTGPWVMAPPCSQQRLEWAQRGNEVPLPGCSQA